LKSTRSEAAPSARRRRPTTAARSGPLGERERHVKGALDAVRADCDIARRLDADPVGFVHRYARPADQEIVALVAACVAFGNVKAIRAKLGDLLERLGPSPADVGDRPADVRARLRGWKHRVFRGEDLACLVVGARAVQRTHGSLGAPLIAGLDRGESLRDALAGWCDAIRLAGGLRRGGPRRGPSHLLPDPRGPSSNKRLLLFLRWMVRPADGVDLGLWPIAASRLLVPVDVHIHKLSRNLGFTRRRAPSWLAAEEITRALARFDPHDPTKYDFSLCHMGMVQRCASRRDVARCAGCGVQPVCVHWVGHGAAAPRAGRQF
jgi:uncharacterized protein (TIGR02757 family)